MTRRILRISTLFTAATLVAAMARPARGDSPFGLGTEPIGGDRDDYTTTSAGKDGGDTGARDIDWEEDLVPEAIELGPVINLRLDDATAPIAPALTGQGRFVWVQGNWFRLDTRLTLTLQTPPGVADAEKIVELSRSGGALGTADFGLMLQLRDPDQKKKRFALLARAGVAGSFQRAQVLEEGMDIDARNYSIGVVDVTAALVMHHFYVGGSFLWDAARGAPQEIDRIYEESKGAQLKLKVVVPVRIQGRVTYFNVDWSSESKDTGVTLGITLAFDPFGPSAPKRKPDPPPANDGRVGDREDEQPRPVEPGEQGGGSS